MQFVNNDMGHRAEAASLTFTGNGADSVSGNDAAIRTPLTIQDALAPVEVLHPADGATVLDFGKNVDGWIQFVLWEPAGRRIRLSLSETPQSEKTSFEWLTDGTTRLVDVPQVVHGFRYVKCEGFSEEIDPVYFTACAV